MNESRPAPVASRRGFLSAAGAGAGALLIAGCGSTKTRTVTVSTTASTAATSVPQPAVAPSGGHVRRKQGGKLPAKAMQRILGIEGSIASGVLSLSVDRNDIGNARGPMNVVFKPSFQLNGDLTFQPLDNRTAFFNGDLALKASELNPVIDAIHAHGLTFQAMHQHFFGLDPMVWFIHFRGEGDALKLARAVRAVIDVTSAKLPQKPPANPTSPLDHAALSRILNGSSEIGDDGVITTTISRKGPIVVGGIQVAPEANISTNIQFMPLDRVGRRVACAPDMAMTAGEVEPVLKLLRQKGFLVGCLYNQETDEQPQLYFSHLIAKGEPLALARTLREALDLTDSA